jgi:subtilisin family serine protease
MKKSSKGVTPGKTATRKLASPKHKQVAATSSILAKVLNPVVGEMLKKEGAAPEVATIVYVHGIGNKPEASVLKCQWDTSLFGAAMGDRTRLAYWVNRDRYPMPESGTCGGKDVPQGEYTGIGIQMMSYGDHTSEPVLNPQQQKIMASLESRMRSNVFDEVPSGPEAKILPLPEGMRRWITRRLTELFLKDVRDFFFDAEQRSIMERSLMQRLDVGGGPFIVIAHSQGSMIAYHVLRQLQKKTCDVRLFVTIGSPLGIQEVQDQLKKFQPNKSLKVPDCVDQWLNVAERLDPVALDADISNDYDANDKGVRVENYVGFKINPEWRSNPHSGTGYLRIDKVREAVLNTAGPAFSNLVGRNILMKDLVADIENGDHQQRHSTLIQLVSDGTSDTSTYTLDESRVQLEALILKILESTGTLPEEARIQRMRRFVSADLTRSEIEQLRSLCGELKIERVWRNAVKRALIFQSSQTIQVKPANLGYGARGQGVTWAVLDTGIAAGHPHFEKHQNVAMQWDCTIDGTPRKISPGDPGFDKLDSNGHGTHVSAVIAGGMTVLDKNNKEINLQGLAPEAKLYGFKVLKDNGNGEDAYIIKALDIIAEINEKAGKLMIQGVNLSLGGNFDPSVFGCGHTPLCQELRRLWQQGVLVCLAAGNEGYAMLSSDNGIVPANMDLSIGDPANLHEAIAVGSIHKTNPHTYGVSYFSSRGPTADGRMKPDLVAPGENILSASHKWTAEATKTARHNYVEMSGTSMATPHVSGLLAAFLSAHKEFIGYPDRVKALLLEHCTDLGRDPYIQGKGMPNLVKMLMNT